MTHENACESAYKNIERLALMIRDYTDLPKAYCEHLAEYLLKKMSFCDLSLAGKNLCEVVERHEKADADIKNTDVEEVIRCYDCEHFRDNMRPDGYVPANLPEWECKYWHQPCDPTGYCCYGEKRGEADNEE